MPASPELLVPRRSGLIKRIFAWMISHNEDDNASYQRKRALMGDLHGSILEIGPGAGANLRYFPAGVEWIGVEPNPFMHPYLERNIQTLGRSGGSFRIDPGDAGGVRLPAQDGRIDAVVSTHVMCSVPYPEETLQEILRVLKPGGRFVFIEHVAAPRETRRRSMQNRIQPLWKVLGDGCHINRETWSLIEQAGFDQVQLEHYRLEGAGLVEPHISGMAIKGA